MAIYSAILLGRMGNPPKTFAIRSNSEAELVRREIQEIRDALEAFKAAGWLGPQRRGEQMITTRENGNATAITSVQRSHLRPLIGER
jgi:hypothetical protein